MIFMFSGAELKIALEKDGYPVEFVFMPELFPDCSSLDAVFNDFCAWLLAFTHGLLALIFAPILGILDHRQKLYSLITSQYWPRATCFFYVNPKSSQINTVFTWPFLGL